MTPVIRIDDQVMDELKKRAVDLGLVFEPPNATLRIVLDLDMDAKALVDKEEVFYILNTNYSNEKSDDKDMINNQKAAAYFDPWKRNIEKLKEGNKVFLYRPGAGIVAIGIASGKLERKPYHGEEKHRDEEYCMKLDKFEKLEQPLPAAEIKKITGVNYRFRRTMFAVDKDSGDKLWGTLTTTN